MAVKGLGRYEYPTKPEDVQLAIEGRSAAATGRGAELREAARMSRGELAHLVGVSKTSLLRWERRESLPSGQHAVTYARVLRQLAAEVAIHG